MLTRRATTRTSSTVRTWTLCVHVLPIPASKGLVVCPLVQRTSARQTHVGRGSRVLIRTRHQHRSKTLSARVTAILPHIQQGHLQRVNLTSVYPTLVVPTRRATTRTSSTVRTWTLCVHVLPIPASKGLVVCPLAQRTSARQTHVGWSVVSGPKPIANVDQRL